MKIIETKIPGVLVFEPTIFGDDRGSFTELFQSSRYAAAGIRETFVQDNFTRSRRGVLRGLHVQHPRPQGKLATVLRGRVLDVAVDVRLGSPTFGSHVAVELSETNHRQIWIPRGFAHGVLVLSEVADFHYKCDETYTPANEIVIRHDDPALAIDWGVSDPVLSPKDLRAPALAEIAELPRYGL